MLLGLARYLQLLLYSPLVNSTHLFLFHDIPSLELVLNFKFRVRKVSSSFDTQVTRDYVLFSGMPCFSAYTPHTEIDSRDVWMLRQASSWKPTAWTFRIVYSVPTLSVVPFPFFERSYHRDVILGPPSATCVPPLNAPLEFLMDRNDAVVASAHANAHYRTPSSHVASYCRG